MDSSLGSLVNYQIEEDNQSLHEGLTNQSKIDVINETDDDLVKILDDEDETMDKILHDDQLVIKEVNDIEKLSTSSVDKNDWDSVSLQFSPMESLLKPSSFCDNNESFCPTVEIINNFSNFVERPSQPMSMPTFEEEEDYDDQIDGERSFSLQEQLGVETVVKYEEVSPCIDQATEMLDKTEKVRDNSDIFNTENVCTEYQIDNSDYFYCSKHQHYIQISDLFRNCNLNEFWNFVSEWTTFPDQKTL